MTDEDVEDWRRVNAILDEALELAPEGRAPYLDRACAGDRELRAEVERILAGADASGFLESPALEFAAPLRGAEDTDTEDNAGPLDGEPIGPYRVVRELGRGGMGVVYLAERADGQYERQVALKLAHRGMDSEAIGRRFLAERQILARLSHPHIARLLDGGVSAHAQPYFAMEYVEGRPITTYCDESRLGIDERLRLFLEVCDAVRYAHQNLVIHRDLKPSNILVTPAGEAQLLDFGIAKMLHQESAGETLTQLGVRVMTPEYASPEQVRGDSVTTAADVYALGAVLYELLTGWRAHRFERRTPAEIERVICEVEPEAPSTAVARTNEISRGDDHREAITPESVSRARATRPDRLRRQLAGDLDTIVLKALQKDPVRRYLSVDALIEDLERYKAGLPVWARPDSMAYRAGKFVARHWIGVAAAGMVLASLVVGLAGTFWEARIAAREAAKAREVKDFVVGLFKVSDPAESRGREITARELLERGRQRVESALARQPEAQVELLHVLGDIHRELGLHEQAEALFRRAVDLARARYGDESLEVANELTDYGTALWAQGKYDQAERVLVKGLAIRRRELGREDPRLAETLSNLGAVLEGKGEFDHAEALYREALSIDRAHYGSEHIEVAKDLDSLGVLLDRAGKFQEANSPLRQALALRRKLLDPDHPLVIMSLHNLAQSLHSQGQDEEAERLEREVLEKRRRLYPKGHPDVAMALQQLAVFVETRGAYEEEEALLLEALDIRRNWLGPDHPDTITLVNNLAVLRYRMGNLSGAESSTREALASWRRELGDEHPNAMIALNNLGAILSDEGRYAEAEPMLRQALALRRKRFGDAHADVGQTLRNLGVLLQREGELPEAELTLKEALAIYRKAFPEGHPRIAEALNGLGGVLTDRGRATEAEPLLQEALAIRNKSHGPTDPRTAETQRTLGVCLAALGRDSDAEALLLESYGTLDKTKYRERDKLETLRRLVAFYDMRGKRQEATRFRKLLKDAG